MNEPLHFTDSNGRPVTVTWTKQGMVVSLLLPAHPGPGPRTSPRKGLKMSATIVRKVRARYKAEENTTSKWDFCKREAKIYKVTPAAIHHVLTRRTWKTVN